MGGRRRPVAEGERQRTNNPAYEGSIPSWPLNLTKQIN